MHTSFWYAAAFIVAVVVSWRAGLSVKAAARRRDPAIHTGRRWGQPARNNRHRKSINAAARRLAAKGTDEDHRGWYLYLRDFVYPDTQVNGELFGVEPAWNATADVVAPLLHALHDRYVTFLLTGTPHDEKQFWSHMVASREYQALATPAQAERSL